MTEPTPNEQISDEQVMNFSWWLCMLPFFAAIGFFIWRWFQNRAEMNYLIYAVGALIIGLVFTAVVAGMGSSAEEGNANPTTTTTGTTDDTTKT